MFDCIRSATNYHHLPHVGCVLSVKITEMQTTQYCYVRFFAGISMCM